MQCMGILGFICKRKRASDKDGRCVVAYDGVRGEEYGALVVSALWVAASLKSGSLSWFPGREKKTNGFKYARADGAIGSASD
jgi:hypothetical protein